MTPKIENRSYGYQSDNVCSVSATLNIYASTDVVASTGLFASYNLSAPDFAAEITRQITTQIHSYMQKLGEVDAFRKEIFPNSVDFADAVNNIFDPIQTAIGG